MSASSALATPATLPGMLPSVSRRAPIRCVHRAAQPCRQAPTRRELVHKCLFLSLVATVGSQPAARAEETDPEAQREAAESYEKSLGIFGCEFWGQKRAPGSNKCVSVDEEEQ
mmetsp:Transcript_13486/g.49061  ORF Transcript_13486/g.49061 Transcript_13486/m.49061 type:complete len:113 (-) Transcript_13486:13-351(-)